MFYKLGFIPIGLSDDSHGTIIFQIEKQLGKMVAGLREERIDESGKKTSPATEAEY